MGNLKHDLRTPLNHIIGYCEMLLEESSSAAQPQLVADLERIHLAGRRLLVVINDLFDPTYLAYMLQYDSTHGAFKGSVKVDGNNLTLDDASAAI